MRSFVSRFFPTFLRDFEISRNDLLPIRNSKLFMNNRQLILRICLSFFGNTLVIYIKKRMRDTDDSCDIPVFTFYLGS